MKANILIIFLIFSYLLTCSGCGTASKSTTQQNPVITDPPSISEAITTETNNTTSTSAWQISILTSEISSQLSATQLAVLYNGETQSVAHEETPPNGQTFLLLDMIIEKTATGSAKFSWGNVSVCDTQGNTYSRHPNDTFLEIYNFKRIKATDLNFGKNEGVVCFLVPEGSDLEQLTFVYADNSTSIEIPLHKGESRR